MDQSLALGPLKLRKYFRNRAFLSRSPRNWASGTRLNIGFFLNAATRGESSSGSLVDDGPALRGVLVVGP